MTTSTILDLPGQAPVSPSTSQNVAPAGAGDAEVGLGKTNVSMPLMGVNDAMAGPAQASSASYTFTTVADNSAAGESATIPSTVGR